MAGLRISAVGGIALLAALSGASQENAGETVIQEISPRELMKNRTKSAQYLAAHDSSELCETVFASLNSIPDDDIPLLYSVNTFRVVLLNSNLRVEWDAFDGGESASRSRTYVDIDGDGQREYVYRDITSLASLPMDRLFVTAHEPAMDELDQVSSPNLRDLPWCEVGDTLREDCKNSIYLNARELLNWNLSDGPGLTHGFGHLLDLIEVDGQAYILAGGNADPHILSGQQPPLSVIEIANGEPVVRCRLQPAFRLVASHDLSEE